MSCNMCRNGLTALGRPCPNGCKIENQRVRYSIPRSIELEKLFSPNVEDMSKPFEGATPEEWRNWRMVSANPAKKKGLTALQRAHWEWCDAVLAAMTDEGRTDPPDVLLSVAVFQLLRIVSALVQTENSGEPH